MSTLFISYSTKDRPTAEIFYGKLVEMGYEKPFRDDHPNSGIPAGSDWAIAPLAEDATREVQAVRETGVEGLVYLGLGLAARPVALAVSRVGWKVERVMNTAGMRGAQPEFGRDIDGWHYIDMHADENRTLVDLRKRLGLDASSGSGPAFGYDVGQLLAEGLARAPELTRDGVVEGLENVKWLPAAEGHEGTLLGFGHFDRGALHGRYLVLRQWRDGASNQV